MASKEKRLIKACPVCGSINLRWASGGADSFLDAFGGTGLGLTHCNNCGQEVMPIAFESLRELNKYRALKRKRR